MRQALASALPPPRKRPVRVAPSLGPWKPIIDQWLTADAAVHHKQRHTARRVWQRLVAEHGAEVGESTVRRYVTQARHRQRMAPGQGQGAPDSSAGGEEGEVDFGKVSFYLDALLTEGRMFVMRLSASGRSFHRVYLNQAQKPGTTIGTRT